MVSLAAKHRRGVTMYAKQYTIEFGRNIYGNQNEFMICLLVKWFDAHKIN